MTETVLCINIFILYACLAGAVAVLISMGRKINTLNLEMHSFRHALDGKKDKRPFSSKPRARRVKPTKPRYDFGSGECIGYDCPKCGADVPMNGHTVAACEEWLAEAAKAKEENQVELAKGSNTETV